VPRLSVYHVRECVDEIYLRHTMAAPAMVSREISFMMLRGLRMRKGGKKSTSKRVLGVGTCGT
jgi:hypothetical protein